MGIDFKPLGEQVMVITGATSGIGLVTARRAASRGVRLSLAARNEDALRELTDELQQQGCDAIYTAMDVSVESDVLKLADATIKHFGWFDTWVNNAAVSIFGKIMDVSIDDHQRLFDVNYWGVVYGSRIACEHLCKRGGKLINIGSALSERAIPTQGIYSASKAAVMGFTDALRVELEQERAPVSVTLIKPGAIDTPYLHRAANYNSVEPKNPPPVYAPETVTAAILHAAENQERDIVVGGGGKFVTVLGNFAPRLVDKIMATLMPKLQQSDKPHPETSTRTLYQPGQNLRERGDYPLTLEHSLYSAAARHKTATAATLMGVAAAGYLLVKTQSRDGR